MIEQITLTNFLSFGPAAHTIALRPLNVLIGPNGSGKSNLVEAFSLLRAVPRDLAQPIRQGGGVDAWLWQDGEGQRADAASLEIILSPGAVAKEFIRYRTGFGSEAGAFTLLDERIETASKERSPSLLFGYEDGQPMLNERRKKTLRRLDPADIDRSQSILSQRRDPESFPEVSAMGDRLREILIYRSWSFGPKAPMRGSCSVDEQSNLLLEDLSNLPARLMALKRTPQTKRRLLELLSEVAPGFHDIEVIVEGGRLQLYLTEGGRNVPAHRLSDGTLRYLSLLAILLDPGPAKLVIIEEPELGLHPDVLPALRDLLIEASTRFQLIVTTHSTQLVDAMTEHPEAVIVSEKTEATTSMSRLDPEDIKRWREFGSLGTLWMSGRLGGTRW